MLFIRSRPLPVEGSTNHSGDVSFHVDHSSVSRLKQTLFYVYVDWTTELCPRPFYVGKGEKRRVQNLTRNHVHTSIKNKHGLHRVIVAETYSESKAYCLERFLIEKYKTYIRNGWGSNLDKGGLGGKKGTIETVVTRQRRSISLKKTLSSHIKRRAMSIVAKQSWTDSHSKALKSGAKKYWSCHPNVVRDALIVTMLNNGVKPAEVAQQLNLDLCNIVYRARNRHQKRMLNGT